IGVRRLRGESMNKYEVTGQVHVNELLPRKRVFLAKDYKEAIVKARKWWLRSFPHSSIVVEGVEEVS
ncbi:hypothetical protein LCGC14_1326250, partial [marine sediment metagenome]